MLAIVAHYRAQPGKGDDVAAVLRKHIVATRAEPGCAMFVVNRSVDEPDCFALYEQYTDRAALESHRESPHFRDYIAGQVIPLLEERTWQLYTTIDP